MNSQMLVIKQDIMVKLVSGLSLVGVAPEGIHGGPGARLFAMDAPKLAI